GREAERRAFGCREAEAGLAATVGAEPATAFGAGDADWARANCLAMALRSASAMPGAAPLGSPFAEEGVLYPHVGCAASATAQKAARARPRTSKPWGWFCP